MRRTLPIFNIIHPTTEFCNMDTINITNQFCLFNTSCHHVYSFDNNYSTKYWIYTCVKVQMFNLAQHVDKFIFFGTNSMCLHENLVAWLYVTVP